MQFFDLANGLDYKSIQNYLKHRTS